MKKTNKILFWIFTAQLSALMLLTASVFRLNYGLVELSFSALSYPTTYIIYQQVISEITGIIAIGKSVLPSAEWCFTGFFSALLLTMTTHFFLLKWRMKARLAEHVFLIRPY